MLACAVPTSFWEDAEELWALVDGQSSPLLRTRQDAVAPGETSGTNGVVETKPPSQTKNSHAAIIEGVSGSILADELSDRVSVMVQRLFDERWQAMHTQVEATLAEVVGFKRQIPNLLNAVSAAKAAASVVGKGARSGSSPSMAIADVSSDIRDLRREVKLLTTVVNSLLAASPKLNASRETMDADAKDAMEVGPRGNRQVGFATSTTE